ncbi:hypothetical protein [Marinobacterium sedimentorum]|uniref:hypothetical protein n=1 Tax=Marinobacterium sedimentorum TaxID=2927804 RepID=UPI0020C6CF49|nr:hypothetical protein [Marinobacterium sedimentorum]MCP8687281.1 hypothetical protein [Marinobacterium sedimentorum]
MLALEIAFDTKKLRKLCENETYADKQLGREVADMLRHRLADMDSALVVTDLVAGVPKKINYDDVSCLSLKLCNSYFIVFCSNNVNTPILSASEVDWKSIRRIKIISIKKIGCGDE